MKINLLSSFLILYFSSKVSCLEETCVKCPGLYCGRTSYNSTCNSECGSCERGYRSNSYFCRKCDDVLELYDWLFLGFMSLTATVLNLYAISAFHDNCMTNRLTVWLLYISAILETLISFIILVLLLDPQGELNIRTCKVQSIKDWYTVFFNPVPDYLTTHRCTVEAVYPLYSAIFIQFLISFFIMVIFRGFLIRLMLQNCGRLSFYAGLYIIPIVAAIHACLAGVLYYIYPYLVLFLSAVGIAVFLSNLSSNSYFKRLREPKNIAILLCYCIAHGYGIISVTIMKEPSRDGPLLLLICLPFTFYTITRPFTRACNFKPF